jgi:hypothetical protein
MNTETKAAQTVGDYDVKGHDLRSYYAGFTRRALPEGAIWRLSMATSTLPQGHPGYMAWMTTVSGTDRFVSDLQGWAIGLGETIARMKPRLRKRSRTYVSSYQPEWGRQAALDGLCEALGLSLWAGEEVSVSARSEQFGCDRDAYKRIRDFVAGALILASWQYEDALRWAHRIARCE